MDPRRISLGARVRESGDRYDKQRKLARPRAKFIIFNKSKFKEIYLVTRYSDRDRSATLVCKQRWISCCVFCCDRDRESCDRYSTKLKENEPTTLNHPAQHVPTKESVPAIQIPENEMPKRYSALLFHQMSTEVGKTVPLIIVFPEAVKTS